MLVIRRLKDLDRLVAGESRLQQREKDLLKTQVRQYFRPEHTVFVFFTEDEVTYSKFGQNTKEGLIEVLRRPGEVAAVYHEESEKTRKNRESTASLFTGYHSGQNPLAKGH